MRGSRSLWLSALAGIAMGITGMPTPSHGQAIDAIFEPYGISREPAPRLPRLLGMGGLTLLSDRDNRLSLWDFARNPVGLAREDSTSTLDFSPGATTTQATRNGLPSGAPLPRQNLGAREVRMRYELIRRTPSRNGYGFYGDLGSDQTQRPFSNIVARRAFASTPNGYGVIAGPIPSFLSGRMSYALRGGYTRQSAGDEYRLILSKPQGQYIDLEGDIVDPPNLFDPDQMDVTATGVGAGLAYELGPWLTAALGVDGLQTKIDGVNDGVRHSSSRDSKRPYGIGQATLLGRIGNNFEWIADGRGWQASNDERWFFSISAGLQQFPLAGRGSFLRRYEEGSQMRGRARWMLGSLELNGEVGTFYRKVRITPPALDDRTSFNFFRNSIGTRPGTDSLFLADSVSAENSQVRDLSAAVGAGWRFMGDRARLAGEFHTLRQRTDQLSSGAGPERKRWDARGGLEYRCSPQMVTAFGFRMTNEDQDELTERNEYVRKQLTAGFTVRPREAHWEAGVGYGFEWSDPDFDSPADQRQTGQQFAAQVRWDL
ncbi:MAG: hypothetical protein HOP12_08525 [Candidatus Eisenbacteria bacterium]|uniref:Uncharacterized protein n=1 Tax=Eiseniibacteriota bacterium TaxID=2212470 RepID=A0A849SN13_UNCEI|nr:hypothetical protein [Candidatus Eisenbacteria bacterium]